MKLTKQIILGSIAGIIAGAIVYFVMNFPSPTPKPNYRVYDAQIYTDGEWKDVKIRKTINYEVESCFIKTITRKD